MYSGYGANQTPWNNPKLKKYTGFLEDIALATTSALTGAILTPYSWENLTVAQLGILAERGVTQANWEYITEAERIGYVNEMNAILAASTPELAPVIDIPIIESAPMLMESGISAGPSAGGDPTPGFNLDTFFTSFSMPLIVLIGLFFFKGSGGGKKKAVLTFGIIFIFMSMMGNTIKKSGI